MLRRNLSGSCAAIFAFLCVLVCPLAASAADDPAAAQGDPITHVQVLNRTAMQYFDDLNYAMAEKTLLQALTIVEQARLGAGPAGLATNGNLAVVYSAGLKKPDKAVEYFKKALALKPDLKLSKARSTPETEANLARAKAEMAGGGSSGAAVPPTAPAGSDALTCPSGGESHMGDEVVLRCTTKESLNPAAVMLYYKPNSGDEFQAMQMTKEGSSGGVVTWIAKVSGSQTQAASLPFFVEASDASGEVLAESGSEENPSVVTLKGAAIGMGPPPVTEEENEDEYDEYEDEEIDDDNPLAGLERERWREHEGSKGSWLLALGVGSGIGYASGHETEAFGKFGVGFNSGIAPASLGHVMWEVAYFIGRKTALSLAGRHQGIFGGPAGTATGAHSLLLRALFFTEEQGKLRWYFALAAGGGEGFRLGVTAEVRDDEGNPTGFTVKDTVRGGPFLAGMGGGMLYKLSRRMHLTIDTQALLGIPQTSAVVDLTAGVRWQF